MGPSAAARALTSTLYSLHDIFIPPTNVYGVPTSARHCAQTETQSLSSGREGRQEANETKLRNKMTRDGE